MTSLRDERGQQLILVALLLPVLIAFLGLVVDAGKVFVHQRRVQNAVDAAATAAGMVLYSKGSTVAASTATYYTTHNGYTDNGSTVRVWVHQPPSSGAYSGNPHYVQIEIQEAVRPIFAALLWNGTFSVRASATAGYTLQALGADIVALKDTACNGYTSLTMNGNPGKIMTLSGIVQVNSPCTNAVAVGNGDIQARAINIAGNGYSAQPNSIFTPAATLNAPQIPDPFKDLPAPDPSSCTHWSLPVNNNPYLPGVYPTDFSPDFSRRFDGSTGGCDGVFYFKGSLSTNNDVITINKGIFYFESGGLTLGGHGKINGSPPDTGAYAGMLVFMARGNTSTFELRGTSQANCTAANAPFAGIVYLPAGNLVVHGTADDCFSAR